MTKKSTASKNADLITQNTIFAWIAAATIVVLLIPLIAMQYDSSVNWSVTDFVTMGVLVFSMSSLAVLVARKVTKKYRLLVGLAFLTLFMYIWAELAVGVFFNFGS